MGEHFWKTWKLVPIIIFVYLRSWKSQLKGGVSPNRESVPGKLGCDFQSMTKFWQWWWRYCGWFRNLVAALGCDTWHSSKKGHPILHVNWCWLWFLFQGITSEWWGDESIEFFSSENGCSIHYKETVVRMRWPSTLLLDFPVVRMRWSTVLSGSVTRVATGSFGFIQVWRSDHVS